MSIDLSVAHPPSASRTVFYYITYMYGIAFRPKKGGVQANLIMDFEAKVGGVYAKKFRGAPRRKGGCTQFDKESGRAWDEFEDRMTVTEAPQTPAGGARQFFFRARARAHKLSDTLPPDKPVHVPCARGFPLSWGARTRAQALAREIFLLPPAVPHAAACARTRRGRQGPRRGLRG